ncbi:glycosyltransferase family 4 protein [Stenotrophomonas maltophilia]|nr:glycosyltransferase family 4 protein [Stenotrophomonas maltophilia]EKU9985968.1 glycosyltransferase family 4 protein [Stenotrophomonas maltophilia]
MKVGIYNRYWATMGGGEKHVGTIAEILLAEGHQVDLIRVGPVDEAEFSSRMNLNLAGAHWAEWPGSSCSELAPRSAGYDVFINSTYCSSMVPQARKSLYLAFFPHELIEAAPLPRLFQRAAGRFDRTGHPWLSRMSSLAQRTLRRGVASSRRPFIDSYEDPMANSEFTAAWIRKRWARDAVVLPPPIDVERFGSVDLSNKKKVILSVGRFFSGGHNKKHIEMITAFRQMHDKGLVPEGWEYHLAGSVHAESEEHRRYFQKVNALAEGYPIRILGNLGSRELLQEYSEASIFWHGAGWGERGDQEPEKLEHFGMTACEAMAAGVVPIVQPLGGPREVVTDGVDGYYFSDARELQERTLSLMKLYGTPELAQWAARARASVQKYSQANFRAGFIKFFNTIA